MGEALAVPWLLAPPQAATSPRLNSPARTARTLLDPIILHSSLFSRTSLGCRLQVPQRALVVASADAGAGRRRLLDPAQLVGAQLDLDRGRVLLQVGAARRPRDGDEVFAPGQDPGQGQLGGQGVLGEAGMLPAAVVAGQVLPAPDAAREQPPAQRAVGDVADAQ